MTAADVALANDFPDLGAVIRLMEPQATADIPEVVFMQRVITCHKPRGKYEFILSALVNGV